MPPIDVAANAMAWAISPRRQLEQPPGRDRATEHRRHRAVKPALHASRRQRFVDAPRDLVADDHRGKDIDAAGLELFPSASETVDTIVPI